MPYVAHPDLRTPLNKTVLWRYMDFAKFVEMLESRTLWFARLDELEDPLEGGYTDAELARIRKYLEKARAKQLISVFRSARSTLYVNCWRAGGTESLAMWDLYGKGSGVVAVKSTVGRLKEAAAKSDESVYISKAKYVDWNDAPGVDNVLVACSRKDLSYQHESEVRIIVMSEKGDKARASGTSGIRLPILVERLVTEVMVGPREPKWVMELVEHVLNRYGLPQRVTASDRLTRRR
jgi:hypothetical protein